MSPAKDAVTLGERGNALAQGEIAFQEDDVCVAEREIAPAEGEIAHMKGGVSLG